MGYDPTGHFAISAFLIGLAIGSLATWAAGEMFGHQLVGGIGSVLGGAGAIATSVSLFAFGPIGWLLGGIGLVAGAMSMAFGSAEIQQHFTDNNWIKATGMSDGWYNGLYIGSNIVSSAVSIGGRAYMNYANVDLGFSRTNRTIVGAKPYQRYSLYGDKGLKQYRFYNCNGDAWFDLDFYHGGDGHRFPHYNIWEGKNRSSLDRSLLQCLSWLFRR